MNSNSTSRIRLRALRVLIYPRLPRVLQRDVHLVEDHLPDLAGTVFGHLRRAPGRLRQAALLQQCLEGISNTLEIIRGALQDAPRLVL